MNTRLAFEDYTALHHRMETLAAIDEKPERLQLTFENRPARETPAGEPAQLAMQTRSREVVKEPEEKAPAMWRSMLQLRVLLPYVSKLLPLLESGLVAHSASAPAQHTAIQPAEKMPAELQSSFRELRIQLQDQAVEFKRVEDQLERLREATERNTLEQQELVEDLKAVGGTLKMIGWSTLALLTGMIGAIIFLALHLKP